MEGRLGKWKLPESSSSGQQSAFLRKSRASNQASASNDVGSPSGGQPMGFLSYVGGEDKIGRVLSPTPLEKSCERSGDLSLAAIIASTSPPRMKPEGSAPAGLGRSFQPRTSGLTPSNTNDSLHTSPQRFVAKSTDGSVKKTPSLFRNDMSDSSSTHSLAGALSPRCTSPRRVFNRPASPPPALPLGDVPAEISPRGGGGEEASALSSRISPFGREPPARPARPDPPKQRFGGSILRFVKTPSTSQAGSLVSPRLMQTAEHGSLKGNFYLAPPVTEIPQIITDEVHASLPTTNTPVDAISFLTTPTPTDEESQFFAARGLFDCVDDPGEYLNDEFSIKQMQATARPSVSKRRFTFTRSRSFCGSPVIGGRFDAQGDGMDEDVPKGIPWEAIAKENASQSSAELATQIEEEIKLEQSNNIATRENMLEHIQPGVLALFENLDHICFNMNVLQTNKTKIIRPAMTKLHYRKFASFLQEARSLAGTKAGGKVFQKIFHMRMVAVGDVLPDFKIKAYTALAKAYIQEDGSVVGDVVAVQSSTSTSFAHDFLAFMESHELDPDGVLVGSRPSAEFLKSVYVVDNDEDDSKDAKRQRDKKKKKKSEGINFHQPSLRCSPTSRDAFVNWVLQLMSKGDGELTEEVKQMGKYLEFERHFQIWNNTQLKPGDLLVLKSSKVVKEKTKKQKFRWEDTMFCRFAGFHKGRNSSLITIFVDHKEKAMQLVDIKDVVPVSDKIARLAGKLDRLASAVHNPVRNMRDEIHRIAREDTLAFLQETVDGNSISLNLKEVVEKEEKLLTANSMLFFDQLRKVMEVLQRTLKRENESQDIRGLSLPSRQVSEISKRFVDLVDDFGAQLPRLRVFEPTFNRDFAELQALPLHCSILCRESLQKYLQLFDKALKRMVTEKANILNGNKKKYLSEWWLKLVNERVAEFLRRLNYDFEAVPANYIDDSPADLGQVHMNLRIIERALKSKGKQTPFSIDILIDDVLAEVYSKIDEFTENASVVICDELNMPLESFNVDTIASYLVCNVFTNTMNEQVRAKLLDLVKDLQYLQTIKILDTGVHNERQQKGDLNIVPISGLIFSVLKRKENELRTVLEVWDKSDSALRGTKAAGSHPSTDSGRLPSSLPSLPSLWTFAPPAPSPCACRRHGTAAITPDTQRLRVARMFV
eukprot:CAMPEP_0177637830 /NCGR_PEP_ID=MMETSP0447-20121125/5172_1 /TAXON_ID=0 /ORGANISM="Stygamoeba regulata, Strain BSH-02190019" /LENGTH=1163 /DNA_ID=CAMNT_0019139767 /DNA_START=231 /DNA_END=3723 /DNA_ORIENTATION=-